MERRKMDAVPPKNKNLGRHRLRKVDELKKIEKMKAKEQMELIKDEEDDESRTKD